MRDGSLAEPIAVPILEGAEKVHGPVLGEWPTRKAGGGVAKTGAFVLPPAIEFEIAGLPLEKGVSVYLEDADRQGRTVKLGISRNSNAHWQTRRWSVPEEWRGARARLVLKDNGANGAANWVAITLPREAHWVDTERVLSAAGLLLSLVLQWGVLVLPGLAGALWFMGKRRGTDAPLTIAALFAACGICAWICFLVYILSYEAGRVFPLIVALGSVAILGAHWSRFRAMCKPVWGLFACWLMFAALYMSSCLLFRTGEGPGEQAQTRFFAHQLPPDNLLPDMLAEKIYLKQPYRPTLFAGWQSSDRPPLQSGFVLLQRSLWKWPDEQYFLLGILLQTGWIPALWALLKRANVNGYAMLTAIAIPAFSQFAFIHDVFVWPKLLSAAFGLLALAYSGWLAQAGAKRDEAVLCGVLVTFAMLSHTGVAFTLLALVVLLALTRQVTLRWLIPFAASALCCYLPWVLYQKLIDPPGDALLKLHLTGTIDRSKSLGTLFRENYAKAGVMGVLTAKMANLKFLWLGNDTLSGDNGEGAVGFPARLASNISRISFFHLLPGLGVANAGWVLRFGRPSAVRDAADRILLLAVVALGIWVALMVSPESTSIHQGSFLTMLLLFCGLALYAANVSAKAAAILVGLQIAQFLFFVLAAKGMIGMGAGTIPDLFPDGAMCAIFAASLAGVISVLWRQWKKAEVRQG